MAIISYQGVVPSKKPKEKKKMFHWRKGVDGKMEYFINYSSLELMQTCMRKAKYALLGEYRTESEALLFGTAIHKALENWYLTPKSKREKFSGECHDAQLARIVTDHHLNCARCMSVFAFCENMSELQLLANDNKRGLANGIDILNGYFDYYLHDPFEVAYANGKPMVEWTFSFPMHEDEERRIYYFGTIDVGLRDLVSGELVVMDHKTTWALGAEFYNRIKPNHQYTGYIWGVRQAGLGVHKFVVNGIQVAKIKRDYRRQFTERDDEDFTELRAAVIYNVDNFLRCQKLGVFPQNAPNPCTMYGGCGYRTVCEVPEALKHGILESNYK